MWLKKKVVVPLSVFSKQLNKSKAVVPKISENGINLTARMGNDQIVIEWQEQADEQSNETSSGSSDRNSKLIAGDNAKE